MEYGRHVARRRRRRLRAIPLAMLKMKKSCMVSMHAYGSVSIIMELCCSSAKIQSAPSKFKQHCFIVLKQAFVIEAQGHT